MMNSQIIEKVIQCNNVPCPNFAYKNPLLDKSVARALSKSFVKILNVSSHNSNINNNLRLSILENIRKICQIEPENHAKVDETFTELLTEFYQIQIKDSARNAEDSTDKELDAFLIRKMKEIDLDSTFKSSINPEIVQALINLNENGVYLETLSNDIIHWNARSTIHACVLKDLWQKTTMTDKTYNDISIKMKSEIEKNLLEICQEIIGNENADVEIIISSNESMMNLIKSCATSSESFQISCSILNFLFIMTNFNPHVQNFISSFVKFVKMNCLHTTFPVLYPIHLSSTVVLLDFEIDKIPIEMKQEFIQFTLNHLHELHEKSEKDFVLLLSHFPQWFDVYFMQEGKSETNNE